MPAWTRQAQWSTATLTKTLTALPTSARCAAAPERRSDARARPPALTCRPCLLLRSMRRSTCWRTRLDRATERVLAATPAARRQRLTLLYSAAAPIRRRLAPATADTIFLKTWDARRSPAWHPCPSLGTFGCRASDVGPSFDFSRRHVVTPAGNSCMPLHTPTSVLQASTHRVPCAPTAR